MPPPQHFLVVDDNADSRYLLVKTLLRKFPQAIVQETEDAETALAMLKSSKLVAAVAHRAADVDGLTLVRQMRASNPAVPIVMVSGLDRSQQALAAGASRFLNYDAWLRIGTVVAETLAEDAGSDPAGAEGPPASG